MTSEASEREIAKRIMYHQHRKNRENMRYQIIAAPACEALARRIEDVRVFGQQNVIHQNVLFPHNTQIFIRNIQIVLHTIPRNG